MKCIFCAQSLKQETAYDNTLKVFACRDCQRPKYNTVYRQLYYFEQEELLHDLIMVDDWCITRWYKSDKVTNDYSLIYKDVIGVMRGIVSMHGLDPEPITINPPACKIDHIVNIDISNLRVFKHKLSTWITFS